jgi:hypothetical protein
LIDDVVEKHQIHHLQHHENVEIYKKCFFIMDKYFPDDEDQVSLRWHLLNPLFVEVWIFSCFSRALPELSKLPLIAQGPSLLAETYSHLRVSLALAEGISWFFELVSDNISRR